MSLYSLNRIQQVHSMKRGALTEQRSTPSTKELIKKTSFWSKLMQCCWTAQVSQYSWDFLKKYIISHWNGLIHDIVNAYYQLKNLSVHIFCQVLTLETREKVEESG